MDSENEFPRRGDPHSSTKRKISENEFPEGETHTAQKNEFS